VSLARVLGLKQKQKQQRNKIQQNNKKLKGGFAAKRLLPLPLHPFGRFCCRRVVFVIFTTAPETNSCLSHNDLDLGRRLLLAFIVQPSPFAMVSCLGLILVAHAKKRTTGEESRKEFNTKGRSSLKSML